MRLAASLLIILAASPAVASPLEDPSLGGAVFTGVTHPHASAIHLNPAALSLAGSGVHLHFGGSLRLDQVRIERRIVDASGTATDGPSVRDTPLSPGAMIAYYQNFQQVSVGVAAYTPQTEELLSDHTDLRYHALGGDHYQYATSISVAWRPLERLSLGATLSIMSSTMEMSFARDTALDSGTAGVTSDCGGTACGVENPAAAEHYDIEVTTTNAKTVRGKLRQFLSTDNIGLTLGVMISLGRNWWLGGSYQSPPGLLSPLVLPGRVMVTRAPRDGGGQVGGNAEVIFNLPQTVHVGARGPLRWLPDYELVAGIRWQNLSRHSELDLRMFGRGVAATGVPTWYPRYRGFKNVWRAQLGLERARPAGPIRWGGRFRFETAAVDDEAVAPHQIATTNLSVAGGAEIHVSDRFMISAGYALTWFPTTNVTDSAFDPVSRIECVDSMLELDQCSAVREGRAVPTAEGIYRRLQHAFTLAVRLRL